MISTFLINMINEKSVRYIHKNASHTQCKNILINVDLKKMDFKFTNLDFRAEISFGFPASVSEASILALRMAIKARPSASPAGRPNVVQGFLSKS